MFKRFLTLSLLALGVVLCSASALASGDTCAAYNPIIPGQCMIWQPSLLPGASWCNGDPGYRMVNVYTGANFGGFCQTFSVNMNVSDLAAYGWNNTTSNLSVRMQIASVKTGPNAWVAFYSSPNFNPRPSELGVGNKCAASSNANTTGLTIESLITTSLPAC